MLSGSVQYLKGVGPRIAKMLKKLGIETIEELIYFFPRDYEDRTQIKPIARLNPSDLEIIKGEIVSVHHQVTRNRFSIIKAEISDKSGSIQAVWFNQPFLMKLLRRGMTLILSGKVEMSPYEGALQITVRDFELDTGENIKIVPRYPLTEGLYPRKMRSIVRTALEKELEHIEDFMPPQIKEQYKLWDLKPAIKELHFPDDMSKVSLARRRLAFDDFFIFQLGLSLRADKIKKEQGIAFKVDEKILSDFTAALPFKLTSAQDRVLHEILNDMQAGVPMNRLLQGDVGSGKTIVATIAALVAIKNGYQAAIMAPTEILAQQHFTKIAALLRAAGIKARLLIGGAKSPACAVGDDLIIGTHALIQKKVKYDKLGLVIIDEQHRFGVLQRLDLVKKGANPDVLVMTATPIPRSLALTLYGDLDRSIIDELPPGRTPIKTFYLPESKRKNTYEFMRARIREGRQVFVVCPLVEESEKVDLKAAMDEADRLHSEIFPEFEVGLMHGRLKAEEKDKIMKEFAEGKIQILVSTTVIEVGIDIPNATVMVVEHAERFGLSQLHQLRGRIGRGSEESFCFLIANTKTPDARTRIKAMLESNNGFELAEVDLRLRGPGEFLGTRQSGLPNFRVADIITDEAILKEARTAAFELTEKDAKSAHHIWQSQRKKIEGAAPGAALN